MLQTTDVDNTAVELVYTVDAVPGNGTLYNNGVALAATDTFTQADVDAGLITYDHDGSQTAADSFDFTVDDGAGTTTTGTFNWTITNTNDAPVNTVPGAQTVNEDTALSITGISVNDVDGNLATTQLSVSNGNLTVSLAGGATISAGTNGSNTLTLRTSYEGGTHPGQLLDDIELDYQRLPISVDNQVWLHDVEAGTQTVSGFSSEEVMVIESPAGEAVLREDVQIDADGNEGYKVTFETVDGKDYLVVAKSAMELPALAIDHPSDLNQANNRGDYLIVAPRDFSATAQALGGYRSTK